MKRSPKMQMLFRVYGNQLFPTFPGDGRGNPRIPDGKTLLTVAQASRRAFRITTRGLKAIYSEWAQWCLPDLPPKPATPASSPPAVPGPAGEMLFQIVGGHAVPILFAPRTGPLAPGPEAMSIEQVTDALGLPAHVLKELFRSAWLRSILDQFAEPSSFLPTPRPAEAERP